MSPASMAEVREATVQAGLRRVRPCLMTTGTTFLALLPVLTSTGRGSDIMVPMAFPVFGGDGSRADDYVRRTRPLLPD